ncbi:MAG: V-type ATPase subunit [Victivallales bacterium]|nr:V-type ATPase subunit [Victivallales bacterium]
MTELTQNARAEYLFARIHALRARAFHGAALQELARAGSEEQFLRVLHNNGIEVDEQQAFSKSLQIRELGILNGLMKQMRSSLASFYHAFMFRTFYKNLKTLLRFRYFQDDTLTLQSLLVPMPFGMSWDVPRILRAESLEDFLTLIHIDENIDDVGSCIRKLMKTRDMILAESELERLSYGGVLSSAKRLPNILRGDAVRLVCNEIDVQNISMMLRNVSMYHYKPERMSQMWLEGSDSLSVDLLTEGSRCKEVREAIDLLPDKYRSILLKKSGGELQDLEDTVWKLSLKDAKKTHSQTLDFRQPLVAYPFLLHFESVNLCRIHECVHFGMSPKEIQGMLID